MSRHLYLLVTVSSSILTVTVISFVLRDIIWTYRQRIQAEQLLRKAKDYFIENRMRERSYADELIALHDLFACHEISGYYHKTANKKNNSPVLSNQNTPPQAWPRVR